MDSLALEEKEFVAGLSESVSPRVLNPMEEKERELEMEEYLERSNILEKENENEIEIEDMSRDVEEKQLTKVKTILKFSSQQQHPSIWFTL